MTTAIDLCSAALIKIGSSSINSFNDGSRESEVAVSLYQSIKRAELTHTWSFNAVNCILSRHVDAPTDKRYTAKYQKPSDCLKIVAVYDSSGRHIDFLSESSFIYTNTESATLKYQSDCDENLFPPLFAEALISKLAYSFCTPMQGDRELAKSLWGEYTDRIKKARFDDMSSSIPRSVYSSSTFVKAHYGANY